MTSSESANPNQAVELSPWVIVTQAAQAGDMSQLAIWRMVKELAQTSPLSYDASDGTGDELNALALFSDQPAAERYAQQYCAGSAAAYRTEQFSSIELIAVLAECYRVGMRCAALNPSGTAAQQIFVLRDVLAAARTRLRHTGSL